MKGRFFLILSVLTLGMALSGCGIKGPLYMPDDTQTAAPAQPDANAGTAGETQEESL